MSTNNSRRNFIRTTGLAATTLPLAGLAANGSRQPTDDPAEVGDKRIIGQNDHRYTIDKQWGELNPVTQPVMHCHEMELDSRGRLLCSTASSKFDVLVYDKKGRVLTTFHHRLVEAHGLSLAGEGTDQTCWLTDSEGGRVIQIDLDGKLIRELSVPADEIPEGKKFKPTETTVSSNGDIYVADGYGTNKIFHYDEKGRLKNVFGGPDHFNCCHGIVVDNRRGKEELLITSRGAENFQRWTMDGRPIATRQLPGFQICRAVIAGDETYFSVITTKDWWRYDGVVLVLDKDFNVVSVPGGSGVTNQQDFRDVTWDGLSFMNPHDVCVDKEGDLYIPQWFSGRTQPVRLKRV